VIEIMDVPTSKHPKTRALLRISSPSSSPGIDRRLFRLVPS